MSAGNLLEHVGHRPWPLPEGPWIMTQRWHDVLFAHWPVDARALAAQLPAGLTLDTFDGQAWIGVVPFHMSNVAPRGVPALPFVSEFPELNVRTYVTYGGKPGVYFFSLDAGSALAVAAARTLFGLPYFEAAMRVETRDGWVYYESRRTARLPHVAEFVARYRPLGPAATPARGSLEHFLTERYCLYTVDETMHARRLEIHHLPWPLQTAEASIEVNTMANAAGVRLPSMAPQLHYAARLDVVAWPSRGV